MRVERCSRNQRTNLLPKEPRFDQRLAKVASSVLVILRRDTSTPLGQSQIATTTGEERGVNQRFDQTRYFV